MSETKLRQSPYILLAPAQYWIGSENYSGKGSQNRGSIPLASTKSYEEANEL